LYSGLKGHDAPVTHGQAVPRSKHSLSVVSTCIHGVQADISRNNPVQQCNVQHSERSVEPTVNGFDIRMIRRDREGIIIIIVIIIVIIIINLQWHCRPMRTLSQSVLFFDPFFSNL